MGIGTRINIYLTAVSLVASGVVYLWMHAGPSDPSVSDPKATADLAQALSDATNSLRNPHPSATSGAPGGPQTASQIPVGDLTYTLLGSEFKDSLQRASAGRLQPTASFLVIHASIKNNGSTPISTPIFELQDETGRSYLRTPQTLLADNQIPPSLPPGVEVQGDIIFDVVKDHHYKIKLSDGTAGGDAKMVDVRADGG